MKKFGVFIGGGGGGQERKFSAIKVIAYVQWSCKSHNPKSLLRIQAENLMSEKPKYTVTCFMQQSHLTETVKNDLILNMTPETSHGQNIC